MASDMLSDEQRKANSGKIKQKIQRKKLFKEIGVLQNELAIL